MRLTLSALHRGAVISDVNCSNKAALMAKLAGMAADNHGLDSQTVLEALEKREELATTGFGGGTAIPHAKIPGIKVPIALFVSLEKPVAYDSVDGEPVDLVFALLSPPDDGAAHLRALAGVSRLLRDEKICSRLRGAADSDALYALLVLADERDAA